MTQRVRWFTRIGCVSAIIALMLALDAPWWGILAPVIFYIALETWLRSYIKDVTKK